MRPAILIAPLLALSACGHADRPDEAPPVAAEVSLEQFQLLRWIEGTWRGSEAGGNPFFESYVFLDDSTIRNFSYPDSTFMEARDSSTIAWASGHVTSTGGSLAWVASGLDSATVRFDPIRNARNSYTWTRQSRSVWTAYLWWLDDSGHKHERLYRMERVGS
jgi:hypothetical protein